MKQIFIFNKNEQIVILLFFMFSAQNDYVMIKIWREFAEVLYSELVYSLCVVRTGAMRSESMRVKGMA